MRNTNSKESERTKLDNFERSKLYRERKKAQSVGDSAGASNVPQQPIGY